MFAGAKVELKHNPCRVQVAIDGAAVTVVKLWRDFVAAKVTPEVAGYLRKSPEALQKELDWWLE